MSSEAANTHFWLFDGRYSGRCYDALRAKLAEIDLDALWANRKAAA
jgi:hypothetical protein